MTIPGFVRWLLYFTVGICAILVVLVITIGWWGPVLGHWLAQPTTLHTADAVVVHGGGLRRTIYGISLYQQQFAPSLWHTGFARSQSRITTFVTDRQVPASAFHWLSTESTWTDGQEIVAYAKNQHLQSLLIITEWWHSRRALCSIREHMQPSDVTIYFASPSDPAGPDDWWRNSEIRWDVISEIVKFGYYFVWHGMNPVTCLS